MSEAMDRARQWQNRLERSRYMLSLLFVASFLETILVPIPIELILVPVMAKHRERVWQIALAVLLGCLTASLIGYGVGRVLYSSMGSWFLGAMGFEAQFQAFERYFASHGFVAILVVGIVPIPFQIAMIAAGVSNYPVVSFVLAAFLARGARYFGIAWLVLRFGPSAAALWRRHRISASVACAALIAVLYAIGQSLAKNVL